MATFYTHYGAITFDTHCRKNGIPAKMQPVPRSVSASCGTCVRFHAPAPPGISAHEDMERCYSISAGGEYTLIEG